MGKALYRKYRSKSLEEIVGQDHITQTLKNAIEQGKINHAYLLTGPRGTGKTSVARILAHTLNGLEYTDHTHLDIIEIDAASNRRIEEIRDLRDRVSTAPTSSKYKVYIIDEVHMLTKEAFNALLKTLEEPPDHVIFILATTEAYKLPATIISRTQRYVFRPVDQSKVVAHLAHIAKQEKITIDKDALEVIAEHGEGSFRDSISLLDQASSLGPHVTINLVESLLGKAPRDMIDQMLGAIAEGNMSEIAKLYHMMLEHGLEPAALASQLSHVLRSTVLDTDRQPFPGVFVFLKDLLTVQESSHPKHQLELILLETAAQNQIKPIQELAVERTAKKAPVKEQSPTARKIPAGSKTSQLKKKSVEAATEPSPQPETKPVAEPRHKKDIDPEELEIESQNTTMENMAELGAGDSLEVIWKNVLQAIKKTHNTLYGIARMATPERDGDTITLHLKFGFHVKRLNEPQNKKVLERCLEEAFGTPLRLKNQVDDRTSRTNAATTHLENISNIFGKAELL